MSDDTKLPKEALLLKLLNMTTVAEDTVAVVAIRRANALLTDAGWSWEKLLAAKITVVADPFASVPAPNNADEIRRTPPRPPVPRMTTTPPAPPTAPSPQSSTGFRRSTPSSSFTPPPAYPPQASAAPKPAAPLMPISSRNNRYGADCYCCGDYVGANQGFLFKTSDIAHLSASGNDTWRTCCPTCNDKGEASVSGWPATRTKRDWRDRLSATPNINSL